MFFKDENMLKEIKQINPLVPLGLLIIALAINEIKLNTYPNPRINSPEFLMPVIDSLTKGLQPNKNR